MRVPALAGSLAALALSGLAPAAVSQTRVSSEAFADGYVKASTAFKEKRMRDAIAAAIAVEPIAATDRERCAVSGIRLAAYADLQDHAGVLAEADKRTRLGCRSPDLPADH